MQINSRLILPALAAVATAVPSPLTAQAGGASASLPLFGAVNLSYAKGGSFTPTRSQVSGRVRMTSQNYDLSCETLTFVSAPPPGKPGGRPVLVRATAEPAAGAQIVADVRHPDARDPLQNQTFHVLADRAAYVPEVSRPSGVKIVRVDFTGHVQVTTNAGFLAAPSLANTDHATILLGPGDDYPSVETGPAHVIATPAQQ